MGLPFYGFPFLKRRRDGAKWACLRKVSSMEEIGEIRFMWLLEVRAVILSLNMYEAVSCENIKFKTVIFLTLKKLTNLQVTYNLIVKLLWNVSIILIRLKKMMKEKIKIVK